MSDTYTYSLEIILEHIQVCEKRFSEIHTDKDFITTEYGNILLDAIVARLQAIGENIKRILKHNPVLPEKYPQIEWNKIILFRDFISHHYEKLDYEVIFEICKNDLPTLKMAIEKELNN
jgi:uncharacterized protein with HEPN domain